VLSFVENDRPALKDLHDHVVPHIADKWDDLGVQLLDDSQVDQLDIIAADHPQDVVKCCKLMLKKWLNSSTDANWNQLLCALCKIELVSLANDVKKKLSTKGINRVLLQ